VGGFVPRGIPRAPSPILKLDRFPGPFEKGARAVEAYDRLKKLIIEADADIQKAAGGNKAAGTRVRQTMQEIKKAAQDVREGILALRETDEPKKS
jgi:hypothetical protein